MTGFLIQSGISMALLLALYYLLLQRESMHGFNRFFLLFAICFSFAIPFVQIEVPAGEIPFVPIKQLVEVMEQPPVRAGGFEKAVPRTDVLPLIYTLLYLVGVLTMLSRFLVNISRLRSMVTSNTVVPFGRSRLVLLEQPVMPHSFLHYIFISKNDFNDKRIEEELYQHESAHMRQGHSWDIIFIELVLIFFWFNPFLYFYKKAIKLNHEFLADRSVLGTNNDVPAYQQILLQKIFMNKASGLASHVHYSLTKKRLIMMTKNTSRFRGYMLKTVAISCCAGLMLTFCIESVAQEKPPPPTPRKEAAKETKSTKPKQPVNEVVQYTVTIKGKPPVIIYADSDSMRKVKDRYYGGQGDKVIYSFSGKGEKAVAKKYSEMTQDEKDALPPPPPVPKLRVPSQEQLDSWLDDKKYGVWLNNKRVSNGALRNYKPFDFGEYSVSRLAKNAVNYGKHYYQVDLTTRDAFEEYKANYIKLLGLDEKQ